MQKYEVIDKKVSKYETELLVNFSDFKEDEIYVLPVEEQAWSEDHEQRLEKLASDWSSISEQFYSEIFENAKINGEQLNESSFQEQISITTIYLSSTFDGAGILCDVDWDDEHLLGVGIVDGKVSKVGGEHIAFYDYEWS